MTPDRTKSSSKLSAARSAGATCDTTVCRCNLVRLFLCLPLLEALRLLGAQENSVAIGEKSGRVWRMKFARTRGDAIGGDVYGLADGGRYYGNRVDVK